MKRATQATLLLFFCLMMPVFVTAQSPELVQTQGAVYAQVEWIEAQDIESVVALLDSMNLKPLILEGDFAVGDSFVHDFFLLPGDARSFHEVDKLYQKARRDYMLDVLSINPGIESFEADLLTLQGAMRKTLQSEPPVTISKVLLSGDRGSIKMLESVYAAKIEQVDILAVNPEMAGTSSQNSEIPMDNELDKATSTWYPNSGFTSTDASAAEGERFVVQYMKWKKNAFTSSSTYEHDFFLYNYDNDGTYLNAASTLYPDCIPKTTYMSTTWPSSAKPYLDTRFYFDVTPVRTGCEKNEIPYTLGVAKASVLEDNKSYQTYIRTTKGNVNRDKFKVQAQLGHRTPSTCYTTWCSFGDNRTNLIAGWNSNVPGTVNWTK